MKLLPIYKWIAGGMPDFTKQFQNNQNLYNQAKVFWEKLESISFFFLLIFIILGVLLACLYYKPYNEQPGRHYTPKHWVYFLIITFMSTFLVTLGVEYFFADPKLDGAFILEMKIAFANAIYAIFVYFFISWLWCQFGTTNAYKFLKV